MTHSPPATHPAGRGILLALVCLLPSFAGCRSLPTQPPMNFSGPGWKVQQGQAVWKRDAKSAGVAGDLLVAMHPDGQRVVQFTKTPLPFLVAQRTTNWWQVQIIPRNKTYAGRGTPPARLIWLHLADTIAGNAAPDGFHFTTNSTDGWSFKRRATGESLEGFFEAAPP